MSTLWPRAFSFLRSESNTVSLPASLTSWFLSVNNYYYFINHHTPFVCFHYSRTQANTKLILYETKIITPTLNTWYDVSPIHLRFYEAQRTRLLSHGSLLESRQGLVQNCSTKDVSEIRILDSGILQILVVVKLEIIMMMTLKGEI